MTSREDLIILFQQLLVNSQTVLTGWSNGGAAGSTVTVQLDSSLGGRNFVSALAFTPLRTGSCILALAQDGNWYAVQQQNTVSRVSVRSHESSPRNNEPEYPIKIFFSVVENGTQKFYVGGDREQPLKIFELDTNVYGGIEYELDPAIDPDTGMKTIVTPSGSYTQSQPSHIGGFIANLGKNKNDWVVGIIYLKYDDNLFNSYKVYEDKKANKPNQVDIYNYGDNVYYLTIITPNSTITYSDYNTPGIGMLKWKGSGLWISDLRQILMLDDGYFWDFEYLFQDIVDYSANVASPIYEPSASTISPIPDPKAPLPPQFAAPSISGSTLPPPAPVAPSILSPSINIANPESWPLNRADIPPFPGVASYTFSPSDHAGIRSLVNLCNFDTTEIWEQVYGSEYIAPPQSAFSGSYSSPASKIRHNMLLGRAAPYSYQHYTEFYVYSITRRCDVTNNLSFNYQGGISLTSTLLSASGSHEQLEGNRKYLVIDVKGLHHQTDYSYVVSDGSWSATRNASTPLYANPDAVNHYWTRTSFIWEVSGTSYIMPGFTTGKAESKIASDSINSSNPNSNVNPITSITNRYSAPAAVTQSYTETVSTAAKSAICLIKKIKVDEHFTLFSYPRPVITPSSVEYFIYDCATTTELKIVETNAAIVNFNPRTDTFISKETPQKTYLAQIPDDIKIKEITVNPMSDKYVKNGNNLEIVKTKEKPEKVKSLKIDTTQLHYIHNISFYS